MSTDRDLKMGRALASIPLPEFREGYYSELADRLEQARPAASPGRRRRVLRVGLVAAAAVAAVVVAVALFGLPGVRESGPQPSLAAQVLAKMTSSLGAVHSFEADEVGVDYQSGTAVTSTSHIALTAGGDGRWDAGHGKAITIHNSALGTQWTLKRVRGRLVPESVAIGLPAGTVFSNAGDSANAFMQQSYSTALRALLAARQKGMDVRPSTFQGRPAWVVTFAYDPSKAVEIRLTIDQQTGLVFASGQYKKGQPASSTTSRTSASTSRLPRGCSCPPAGLHLDPPRAIPPGNDRGFKRVPLSRVEPLVGYAALVPARVPAGYALADVTATAKSPVHAPGSSPSLVSMVYRRGFSSFTVALMPDEPAASPTPGEAPSRPATCASTSRSPAGRCGGSRADVFIGLGPRPLEVFVSGPRRAAQRHDPRRPHS